MKTTMLLFLCLALSCQAAFAQHGNDGRHHSTPTRVQHAPRPNPASRFPGASIVRNTAVLDPHSRVTSLQCHHSALDDALETVVYTNPSDGAVTVLCGGVDAREQEPPRCEAPLCRELRLGDYEAVVRVQTCLTFRGPRVGRYTFWTSAGRQLSCGPEPTQVDLRGPPPYCEVFEAARARVVVGGLEAQAAPAPQPGTQAARTGSSSRSSSSSGSRTTTTSSTTSRSTSSSTFSRSSSSSSSKNNTVVAALQAIDARCGPGALVVEALQGASFNPVFSAQPPRPAEVPLDLVMSFVEPVTCEQLPFAAVGGAGSPYKRFLDGALTRAGAVSLNESTFACRAVEHAKGNGAAVAAEVTVSGAISGALGRREAVVRAAAEAAGLGAADGADLCAPSAAVPCPPDLFLASLRAKLQHPSLPQAAAASRMRLAAPGSNAAAAAATATTDAAAGEEKEEPLRFWPTAAAATKAAAPAAAAGGKA